MLGFLQGPPGALTSAGLEAIPCIPAEVFRLAHGAGDVMAEARGLEGFQAISKDPCGFGSLFLHILIVLKVPLLLFVFFGRVERFLSINKAPKPKP